MTTKPLSKTSKARSVHVDYALFGSQLPPMPQFKKSLASYHEPDALVGALQSPVLLSFLSCVNFGLGGCY